MSFLGPGDKPAGLQGPALRAWEILHATPLARNAGGGACQHVWRCMPVALACNVACWPCNAAMAHRGLAHCRHRSGSQATGRAAAPPAPAWCGSNGPAAGSFSAGPSDNLHTSFVVEPRGIYSGGGAQQQGGPAWSMGLAPEPTPALQQLSSQRWSHAHPAVKVGVVECGTWAMPQRSFCQRIAMRGLP